jgi:hypothetical protein
MGKSSVDPEITVSKPAVTRKPAAHILIGAAGFLVVFAAVFAVSTLRKPNDYVAGKAIVVKTISGTESLPAAGAAPDAPDLPVYQLYGDGLLVCNNTENLTDSKQYQLTQTQLGPTKTKQIVKSIHEGGFNKLADVSGSKKAGQAKLAGGYTTLALQEGGKVRTVTHMEDGSTPPKDFEAIDSILSNTCKGQATQPYYPATVVVTVTKLSAPYDQAKINYPSQKSVEAISPGLTSLITASRGAATDKSKDHINIVLSNSETTDAKKELFADSTTAIINVNGVAVLLSTNPMLPISKSSASDTLKAQAHTQATVEAYQQKLDSQEIGQAYQNTGDKQAWLTAKLFPKVGAADFRDPKIHIFFLEADGSEARDKVYHCTIGGAHCGPAKNTAEDEIKDLRTSVYNWYSWELGRALTNSNWTSDGEKTVQTSSKSLDFLTTCSSFGYSGLKDVMSQAEYDRRFDQNELAALYRACVKEAGQSKSSGIDIAFMFNSKVYLQNESRLVDKSRPNSLVAAYDKNIYVILDDKTQAFNSDSSGNLCGQYQLGGATGFAFWKPDGFDPEPGKSTCSEHTSITGYELGSRVAHELGHGFGLPHSHAENGHPQYGTGDIMNYQTEWHNSFPDNIHLSDIQKWFINESPAVLLSYSTNGKNILPGTTSPLPPTPAPPPAKDPRRGEDDGRWSVWPNNSHYYTNPALPGRCVYKASNGTFAVGVNGADYDCAQLAQMYKCQNEFAKLDPTKPETFANANISPECGNQANIRAAGQFVQMVKLSESVPKGSLDGRNSECTIQAGWAYSEANRNIPIDVHLYYDGPAGVGTGYQVKTDIQRDDLKGFGNNGIHGFNFQIPDRYKDNKPHTVYAYAIGIKSNGWKNDKNPLIGQTTFSCDYPPQGNVEAVNAKMNKGSFECKVQGWAYDRTDGNQALQVHAYIDGFPGAGQSAGAAIGTADVYRTDLLNAGQGNGKHGFIIDIPAQFRDANKHKVRVYAIGVYPFNVPDGTHPLIGEMDFQCDNYVPAGNLEQVIIRNQGATKECVVAGWAADLSASIYSNNVALYFDLSPDGKSYGLKVDSYLANLNRPDVRAAGYGWGNAGNHGFEYVMPKPFYYDGKQHTVSAYSLNIDWYGSYMKQNNTFIGKKTFTCPK